MMSFRPAAAPAPIQRYSTYQVHRFRTDIPVDTEELRWCLDPSDRLALVMPDISPAGGQPLSDNTLCELSRLLRFFGEHGKQVILRPVYDADGKGMEREPASFQTVLGHLGQIGAVARENHELIHTMQGFLVGNWGELHGSKFLSDRQLCAMCEALLRATDEKCFLSVRTPAQHRALSAVLGVGRVGLFNDGLFGSDTHLGTFISPDDEDYAADVCKGRPFGGEAVNGCEFSPDEIVRLLKKTQITYLNRVYDAKVLDKWKTTPYKRGDLYGYIRDRLGHRFVVVKTYVKVGRRGCRVSVVIKNEGFGELTKPADIRVTLGEAQAEPDKRELPPPGGRRRLVSELPKAAGELALEINGEKLLLGTVTM